MTTLDERFQKGIATRTKFGGGTLTAGSTPLAWPMAPDLERIAGEFLFGSVWHRPALKDKQREMITLTCLTVLKRDNQTRRHLSNALNLGLTPIEIVEVLMHSMFYSGVPATLDALAIAKEVFEQRGIDYTPQQVFDSTETPDELYNRGVARRIEYMGPPASGGLGSVTHGCANGPRSGKPVGEPHSRRAERRAGPRRDRGSLHPRNFLLRSAVCTLGHRPGE